MYYGFEWLIIIGALFFYFSLRNQNKRIEKKLDELLTRGMSASSAEAKKSSSTEVHQESVVEEAQDSTRDDQAEPTQPAPAVAAEKPVKKKSEFSFSPLDLSETANECVGQKVARAVEKTSAATPEAGEREMPPEMSFVPEGPSIIEKGVKWVQVDWPMKVGGLLVILAVGWFVTYAAEQGWLSEVARVTLGYIFGVAALAYGAMRAEKVTLQGNVFLIIGIAAIFISTIAAVEFPTVQMSESAALIVMLLTVITVSLISLRQKKMSLTASMITFGAVVPVFFYSGLSTELIFTYLLILTIGTLWIVVRTGWRELTALMLTVVGVYSLGHYIDAGGGYWTELILSMVFAAVFYGVNVASIIESKGVHRSDIYVAVLTGVLYTAWVLWFSPEQFEVLFLVLGALVFTVASHLIFVRTRVALPTLIYGVIALSLIVIATALQFDGAVLTVAYLAESAAVVSLVLYFFGQQRGLHTGFLVFIAVVPLVLVFGHIVEILSYIHSLYKGNTNIPIPELFAVLVAVGTFAVMAMIAHMKVARKGDDVTITQLFGVIGSVLALAFVWLATHLFIANQDVATFTSLIIYTIVGVWLYVSGTREEKRGERFAGAALFALVLARIFIVEFWDMDMLVRIITFFIIGALFISTAFITHRMSQK